MSERKYGRPKKRTLDQEKISAFLEELGFDAERRIQEWRHLIAFGTYQANPAVFKLASTQETGKRTQNEYNWNEAVHSVPEENRQSFTVPQNYKSGHYGKLFYFICDWFTNGPLVAAKSSDLSLLAPRIEQIAVATRELETLPIPEDSVFATSQKQKKRVSIGERLLESTTEWALQVPRNLEPFLKVVESAKDSLRTCVGHGDFVARQLYDVDGKIGVIDGEHAGASGPLYYDVAQFYLRLRLDHNGEELGREYLKHFKNLLSVQDQGAFWEELKPVLIQRYIGDLWGGAKNKQKLDELEPFGREILEDEII